MPKIQRITVKDVLCYIGVAVMLIIIAVGLFLKIIAS